jgi:large subunit ribosomal protein L9
VKVIFIEDVPDVALAGEAKEVADGYGRNYLLPKKLAVLANSQASGIVEAQLKKVSLKRAQAEKEMSEIAAQLNGMEITLKAKVGEKERLYGSVTGADIAEQLSSSAGLDIDKRKIELDEPIRQVGSYEVTVRFTQDITAVVMVTVEADKVEAKEEEEGKPEDKKAKKKSRKKAEAEAAEAEVKVGEAEADVEETEVKAEEAEVKAEAEEAEAKVEKPKAKKKSQKKVKAKAEEAEAKAEETEVKAEKVEEKEAEPGE